MPTAFSIEHDGRRIEVVPDSTLTKDRVRLLVDGEVVAEAKPNGADTVVAGDGVEVRVVMPWHGASITRAELVVPDGPVRLVPAPGSAAARRERLERERPGLYAARHVAKGVAQALAAVIGIGFAIRLLPDISLPIDLPEPDLPDLPLPSIDLRRSSSRLDPGDPRVQGDLAARDPRPGHRLARVEAAAGSWYTPGSWRR